MKTYHDDVYRIRLINLGVNPLSMEGCGMGTRIDTDVCPSTVPLVEEYLGGIRLTHDGFNGWSKDPNGKWYNSKITAYKDNIIKEGWSTHQGKCFKLPVSMVKELLIFLLLKNGHHIISVTGKAIEDWGRVIDRIHTLDEEEYMEFYQWLTVDNTREPKNPLQRAASGLKQQALLYHVDYSMWMPSEAGSNRHSWTGKDIK